MYRNPMPDLVEHLISRIRDEEAANCSERVSAAFFFALRNLTVFCFGYEKALRYRKA